MQLTQHTDYALRVAMYLAMHPGKRVTIEEVAAHFRISRNHLMKVAQHMAAKGQIVTVRGKGGGIRLARSAAEMSVGAIVRDMEGAFSLVECFAPGGSCAIGDVCRLQKAIGRALEAFLLVLDEYTIADITRNRGQLAEALGLFPIPRASRPDATVPA